MLPEMAFKLFDNMNWGDTERNIWAHIKYDKMPNFPTFSECFQDLVDSIQGLLLPP